VAGKQISEKIACVVWVIFHPWILGWFPDLADAERVLFDYSRVLRYKRNPKGPICSVIRPDPDLADIPGDRSIGNDSQLIVFYFNFEIQSTFYNIAFNK
jgi:hypothetical protein